jgi:hypothetical protein
MRRILAEAVEDSHGLDLDNVDARVSHWLI